MEAPDEMAGQVTACPACGKQFEIPGGVSDAPDPGEALSPLRAAMGGAAVAADDAVREPAGDFANCGAAMEESAVLCLECGYHSGLGKIIETDLS